MRKGVTSTWVAAAADSRVDDGSREGGGALDRRWPSWM